MWWLVSLGMMGGGWMTFVVVLAAAASYEANEPPMFGYLAWGSLATALVGALWFGVMFINAIGSIIQR